MCMKVWLFWEYPNVNLAFFTIHINQKSRGRKIRCLMFWWDVHQSSRGKGNWHPFGMWSIQCWNWPGEISILFNSSLLWHCMEEMVSIDFRRVTNINLLFNYGVIAFFTFISFFHFRLPSLQVNIFSPWNTKCH